MWQERKEINWPSLGPVIAVWMDAERHQLVFEFNGHKHVKWDTYSDCCSETWFDTITGIDALKGTIAKVEEVDLPDDFKSSLRPSRQESDAFYGYRISTAQGICDLVFRNSSNGYYGGSAWPVLIEDEFLPKPSKGWRIVKDDE